MRPHEDLTSHRAPPGSGRSEAGTAPLTVIGIGASAGGLKALQQFVEAVPEDSGLAFVVIVHLDPGRDLLESTTLEHDRTVAELQTVNEEIQSMNEEQRAATEELETGREVREELLEAKIQAETLDARMIARDAGILAEPAANEKGLAMVVNLPDEPLELTTDVDKARQVDGASTRAAGGLGIGLAAAREYARLLGGGVTVESELGRGSTFRFWLPR